MSLLTLAKMKRLAISEREFDVQVLRSTLEYYNSVYASPDYRERFEEMQSPMNDLFSWITPVLKLRAESAGMSPDHFHWRGPRSLKSAGQVGSVLLFMFGAFKKYLDKSAQISFDDASPISSEKWLFEILGDLRIESRYTKGKTGSIELASLPHITSPESAVAYALALVKTNRHEFKSRVRPCLFLKDERPGMLTHHFYLADDARQKFCSSPHANAHRQRELRRRAKQVRKPK